jgi:hypothetical protein
MLNGGVLPLDLLDARTNDWIHQQKHHVKPPRDNIWRASLRRSVHGHDKDNGHNEGHSH